MKKAIIIGATSGIGQPADGNLLSKTCNGQHRIKFKSKH